MQESLVTMDYIFDANFFDLQNDGVFVLALAERPDGAGRHVILQKTIEPDEQDVELAWDTVYIEVEGEERSGYGGIRKVTLSDGEIRIDLNERGREFLGIDGKIVMHVPRHDQKVVGCVQEFSRCVDGEFPVEVTA